MKGIEVPAWSWLPRDSSTLAAQTDQAWYAVTVVSVVFGAIVFATMAYILLRFRRRGPNDPVSTATSSAALEFLWTVIPTVVVLGLFWIGSKGFIEGAVAPGDALEIRATAAKWSWTFTYPSGYTSSGELTVPKGKPVKIVLSSKDVIHSFFIPEFRVKRDAVPGAYTSVWFQATRTGETLLQCAEYCGTGHSDMLAKVVMKEPADFDKWLENAANGGNSLPPAEAGKALFTKSGCNGCHSLDGTRIVGPSFKGLAGKTEALADGKSVQVDDNYLRESILNPGAKIVASFPPGIMPTFQGQLTDQQVDALIAFIKTVK